MDGYLVSAFYIALPFIIFGAFVCFLIFKSLTSLRTVFSKRGSKRNVTPPVKLLAGVSLFILLAGGFLILSFIMVGGPNQGLGRHFIESPSNRYLQLQIGMITILVGGLMLYITRGIVSMFGWKKLTALIVTSFVLVFAFVASYISTGKRAAQQAIVQKQQYDAKIASLPPVYVPDNNNLETTDPRYGRLYSLTIIDDYDKVGYQAGYTNVGKHYFDMTARHSSSVKEFFDPANNVCDMTGLYLGWPTTGGVWTCVFAGSISGGTLYTSTQYYASPRAAWVKNGYVHYITVNTSMQDLRDFIGSLKVVSKDQVREYL